MSGSAITMMVIGMLIIWGGLAASVMNAVSKAKKAK
ncbi:methionine/alanine import family NSS transporter small subunit [Bacillus sp. ISL-47]|nr:methionine/alanine import family NSS transporter small subunit [Bacillus sp. ISL-47]MBT2687551.1 methionine/alanine import family NSS transporter small subunit [Bacillus sp. ISL-47]MBT2706453.1 methionine/alanine import family NSS transporter small subunit [Pseudomonas sp. ISL-84]